MYEEIFNKQRRDKLQKAYTEKIDKKTMYYQKKYHFELSNNYKNRTWDNEADAFKHTFGSADTALKEGNFSSLIKGVYHEHQTPHNPSNEKNMDLWNNHQGRIIADEIRKEYGSRFYKMSESNQSDIIAEKIIKKMHKGELITHPSDKRKYKGFETGLASNIDNINLKTEIDEKGNKYTYIDDGNEITKDFLNSLDTKNRLIYNDELNLINEKDQKVLNRAIDQFLKKEYYTKQELDLALKNGGLIHVDSYTRLDGTNVSGYYRRR